MCFLKKKDPRKDDLGLVSTSILKGELLGIRDKFFQKGLALTCAYST